MIAERCTFRSKLPDFVSVSAYALGQSAALAHEARN